jgi:hypothetical protein
MTHPLTDEIIGQIQTRHGGPRYGCYPDFRAVADWQLEQVIEWLKDYTKSVEFRYHPQYVATRLKEEMRPQEDNS